MIYNTDRGESRLNQSVTMDKEIEFSSKNSFFNCSWINKTNLRSPIRHLEMKVKFFYLNNSTKKSILKRC